MLRRWNFFHSPPGFEHIFVGAGDGPCAILMLGPRVADEQLRYPVSELAARYGASVEVASLNPDEVYADAEEPRLGGRHRGTRCPGPSRPTREQHCA